MPLPLRVISIHRRPRGTIGGRPQILGRRDARQFRLHSKTCPGTARAPSAAEDVVTCDVQSVAIVEPKSLAAADSAPIFCVTAGEQLGSSMRLLATPGAVGIATD